MNEYGVTYTLDELTELTAIAQSHDNLKVHMDGARFANAIVGLNVSPADMTWRIGRGHAGLWARRRMGLMAGEIIVCFDPTSRRGAGVPAEARPGTLLFENAERRRPHWRPITRTMTCGWHNAQPCQSPWRSGWPTGCPLRRASSCASPAVGQSALHGRWTPRCKQRLMDAGAYFQDWPDDGPTAVRMVTAFNTRQSQTWTP